MRNLLFVAVSSLALVACGTNGAEEDTDTTTAQAEPAEDYGYETYDEDNLADSMASNDDATGMGDSVANEDQDIPDSEERPIMQAQVVLDRVGFGPGVIDGKMGMSTENAILGFQEANDLETTGKLDEATKTALSDWDSIPATRVVTIPASWGETEYTDIPEDPEGKAALERLGYKSLDERLAERFHTTVEVLKQLNPGGQPAGTDESEGPNPQPTPTPDIERPDGEEPSFFQAGQQIRVPNIGGDRIEKGKIEDRDWQRTLASLGVGSEQTEVDRIVVSKAGKTLKAYQGDKLVALFTVSSGSSEFPLPLGEWDIVGEAYNPPYRYDPEVLGNDDAKDNVQMLPPGPNSPVGVIWIDLSKEHYGIHGTPDPETIGRAQSSGCVRLTNWDAARLAGMVSQSTRVIFEA
ncbi:L,D-transpeptidase family protein [Qipengyuania xiapuensis]|uniref:L,D-transpeptidase family protein n=1 Tax=Qipengyuania xiapuensis TaxID=2867236 RepID=A0ABX8ZTW1_9SPHN|nr:L,D-transpeptidase family protein [Qipengyuania xiapuensis]QZD92440.1 L,D-transpeptidase family protein [Qipengyuania xiapuensis]